MQRTEMDPVHQQVQVQTDAADWDVSGSSTSSSSNRCSGLGWIRFINKFKFKQMQRTGMYPVDQPVGSGSDPSIHYTLFCIVLILLALKLFQSMIW